MSRVLVVTGAGGVGKTTASAALAVGEAMEGSRVVVLTIDPAKRLADALGLEALGNEPAPVALDAPGTLHALMLDREATWDQVIRRHAPSPELAERVLSSRYYEFVSTRLTGSHEYMALEKLHELLEAERWDVVVVDTPPAQHALDFLHAPQRLEGVFEPAVLNLFGASRGGIFGFASRGVAKVFLRLAGDSAVSEIESFLSAFAGLATGFIERSRTVQAHLRSSATRFFLVTTSAAAARNDAVDFMEEALDQGLTFSGVVINRATLPPAHPEPVDTSLLPCPPDVDEAQWREVLAQLERWKQGQASLAAEERASADRLREDVRALPFWWIPELGDRIRTLEGLTEVARHLPPLRPGET